MAGLDTSNWLEEMTPNRAIAMFLEKATPHDSPDPADLAQVIITCGNNSIAQLHCLLPVVELVFSRLLLSTIGRVSVDRPCCLGRRRVH